MARICCDTDKGVKIANPKIHVSALRRVGRATAGYAPAGIPNDARIVGTHDGDEALVEKMSSAFKTTADSRDSGFKEVRRFVSCRHALYFVFLAYSLGILAVAGWFYWFGPSSVEQADVAAPRLIDWVFDLIKITLPDYLFGFFLPLLEQARIHWFLSLIVILVLVALVVLKFILERKSRRLGLDAWRDFREAVYPEPGITAEPAEPE